MKKVLTIGNAVRDLFLQYDTSCTKQFCAIDEQPFIGFAEGTKIEITQLDQYLGGGAANSAASFSRLGFDSSIACKIGNDKDGDFIISCLQQQHVNTKYVITAQNGLTGTSIIIPCSSGNRAVLVYRGTNTTMTFQEISQEALNTADIFYVTSLSGESSQTLNPIAGYAQNHNKMLAVNPGSNQIIHHQESLISSLSHISILILNTREACTLLSGILKTEYYVQKNKYPMNSPELLSSRHTREKNIFDMQTFIKTIHALGPHIIAVTNGKEGVYVSDRKTLYFHPSIATTPVSTVGAGDAFGSTFVAFLALDYPLHRALQAGLIQSSSVIQHQGSQTGLICHEKIKELTTTISPQLLVKVIL